MTLPRKLAPIPTIGKHRKDAELEAWICARLNLRDLFVGITSREVRRDRLKAVLIERGLIESIAGTHERKPVSWRAMFKQLHGEELA